MTALDEQAHHTALNWVQFATTIAGNVETFKWGMAELKWKHVSFLIYRIADVLINE